MSSKPQVVGEPSDAELISAVRGGDLAGYGLLYERHVEAARRLARQLSPGPDADDLVADAFAKVLATLQRGGGPDVSFRAYLLTALRSVKVDGVRASSRVQPTDEIEAFDQGVPFRDTAVEGFENAAAAAAFSSLPERWQLVLWHTEVEGQKPAEIAPLLGMTANSVAALAYRSREGLRQAFLTQHASEVEGETCRWTHQNMGAYVRRATSNRDSIRVQNHLRECVRCATVYAELSDVNSNLAGVIAPLLLGGLAAGYLSTSAGAASGGLVGMLFGRARDAVSSNAPVATAVGVATVAAVAVAVAASTGLMPGKDAPATLADRASVGSPAAPGISVPPEESDTASTSPSPEASVLPSALASPSVGVTPAPSPLLPSASFPAAPPFPSLSPDAPQIPTASPSFLPTEEPDASPEPTLPPTFLPTSRPTPSPSPPSTSPSRTPTRTPSPTSQPTPTPTPSAAPISTPSVTPTPTPTPTRTPTPSPTSSPAPGPGRPSPDLSVSATSTPDGFLGHEVTVTVSGLPSGEEAEVELTVDRFLTSVRSDDSSCSTSGSTAVCRLQGTGLDLRIIFTITALMDSTATVRVTGVNDPDLTNNTTQVHLVR